MTELVKRYINSSASPSGFEELGQEGAKENSPLASLSLDHITFRKRENLTTRTIMGALSQESNKSLVCYSVVLGPSYLMIVANHASEHQASLCTALTCRWLLHKQSGTEPYPIYLQLQTFILQRASTSRLT